MATQPPAVPHCPLPPLPHRSDPLFGAAGAKDCGHWFVLPPRPSHPPPPAATQQHQQQQHIVSEGQPQDSSDGAIDPARPVQAPRSRLLPLRRPPTSRLQQMLRPARAGIHHVCAVPTYVHLQPLLWRVAGNFSQGTPLSPTWGPSTRMPPLSRTWIAARTISRTAKSRRTRGTRSSDRKAWVALLALLFGSSASAITGSGSHDLCTHISVARTYV